MFLIFIFYDILELNIPQGHGYACVRVDMRGSGDSSGILDDEYSAQELTDAEHTIAWITAQPWSDGQVTKKLSLYNLCMCVCVCVCVCVFVYLW